MSLPDWLTQPAPRARTARAITPSAASGAAQPIGDRKALARGRIVHRLLQALPAIAPERRAEAIRRYLARDEKDFSDAERAVIAAEVLTVLDDPRFAPLFAPDSRAEVPIVGRLPGGVEVSGQVDRLAVTAEAVLIADYKTNRPAPQRVENVPQAYVRQLALYRAVLGVLYPGRAVRAALVWTEGPALMEVPGRDARCRAVKRCGCTRAPWREGALTLVVASIRSVLIRGARRAHSTKSRDNSAR